METLIFKIALKKSKPYLRNKYSEYWYYCFYKSSFNKLKDIIPKIPNIGNSIFSFNYNFAPVYIAWFKTFKEMNITDDEITRDIWAMNECMSKIIPKALLHMVGKTYLNSFRKKAIKHIEKQTTIGLHPYDWNIEFRNVNSNCFEIDIKTCGIKKLAKDYNAEGLLPGICRMDYLFASLMNNGFERTKTLADGDDCCNCRYYLIGNCEWNPENGFIDRK